MAQKISILPTSNSTFNADYKKLCLLLGKLAFSATSRFISAKDSKDRKEIIELTKNALKLYEYKKPIPVIGNPIIQGVASSDERGCDPGFEPCKGNCVPVGTCD